MKKEEEEKFEEETTSLGNLLSPDDGEDDSHTLAEHWREIMGGKFLTGRWLLKNIFYILMLVAMVVMYIGNRYYCLRESNLGTALRETLLDREHKALTRRSQLLESTRRSHIEENLRDSTLQTAVTAPFVLPVDNE